MGVPKEECIAILLIINKMKVYGLDAEVGN